MPVYLKDVSEFPELERFGSVLIVPCRFCPAASMAVSNNEPYFQLFRRFLKTASYERLLKSMKSDLENQGIKTDIFKTRWLHQFALCMWSSKRRTKLLERAGKYEALVVMGCEAAVQTVHDSVKSASCRLFQGMRSEGIMSIKPFFSLPGNISIEFNSLTPLLHQAGESRPWVVL
jgi:hypothetical protein